MTTSVEIETQQVHVHQTVETINIPVVQSVTELANLPSSDLIAILHRPPRALMFPMFANANIPELDVRVSRLAQRFVLLRGDALHTWAGNSNAGPTQPARFGFIDNPTASNYQDPANADWLVPAADVSSLAVVLPQGWIPLSVL